MTRIALSAIALTLALAAPAIAGDDWEAKTASAYVSVYSYYCAPGFSGGASAPEAPSSMEIALYTDQLRADYGNDCRAFYLGEVAPRLGVTEVAAAQ